MCEGAKPETDVVPRIVRTDEGRPSDRSDRSDVGPRILRTDEGLPVERIVQGSHACANECAGEIVYIIFNRFSIRTDERVNEKYRKRSQKLETCGFLSEPFENSQF